VDQERHILDILVRSRQDKAAARTFFYRLLNGLASVPQVMISDKLASDGAAK
jgi:putative transposase